MTTKELEEELENRIQEAEKNRAARMRDGWDYFTGVIAAYTAVLMVLRKEV